MRRAFSSHRRRLCRRFGVRPGAGGPDPFGVIEEPTDGSAAGGAPGGPAEAGLLRQHAGAFDALAEEGTGQGDGAFDAAPGGKGEDSAGLVLVEPFGHPLGVADVAADERGALWNERSGLQEVKREHAAKAAGE